MENKTMLKAIISSLAACTIAAGAFTFVAPAQAAEFGVYVGPNYHSSCRHWSERLGAWVWTCPRSYNEYYNQGPSFGFEFGMSGDRRHHEFERR
jgi:hypothetical protein